MKTLSLRYVARQTGRHMADVRKMAAEGQIPSVKVKNVLRLKHDAVDIIRKRDKENWDSSWWKYQCMVLWMKAHGQPTEPGIPVERLVIPSNSELFEWLYKTVAKGEEGQK